MKNRTSLFCFLTLILCLGANVAAQDATVEPANVYPGSSLPAAAGETLTVDIDIAGGSGVAGYELTVAFDTSALTYVSAANATYLPTGAFAPAPRVSGNRVTLTAAAGSAATKGGGTLATVTFRVAAVKASTLRLQNVTLSDIDGENLAVRAWTNSVSVVRSSGAAWDVNQDGTVNVSDLVLVARHLGSSSPANPRVDVNQDGSVNVSDLVLVARHLGEEGEEGDSSVQVVPIDIPGGGDRGDDDTRERTEPPGMVLIPAGQFQMGTNDEAADNDEQPVHTVHLDAFYMDTYEVTNAQFKAFVDANPQWQKDNIEDRFHNGEYLYFWSGNNYPSGKADHPVTDVSWYAAMAYAEWAGKRLPTEAEWEYAARGGLEGQKYPSGNTLSTGEANYNRHVGDTTPVGQYAANGYGLYDMAGNVWEWCLDEYDADFYFVSRDSRNPISGARTIQWILDNFTSIPTNSSRVLRGGSWFSVARNLRVANRDRDAPTGTSDYDGFRCARAVTP